jgi:glyoxylase-like metal-dependent hydrolase (beta-lactamase superfamily II)
MLTIRRTSIASTFTLLAAGALYLTAQPNTVKQIADGVWFREGDLKGEGHCNNIIIEMKDYLVVIDANFPSGARKVIDDAMKLSAKPIRYVFDTHHHGDHAYANAVWTKHGATTLAHENVVREMKDREPARWLDAAKTRSDVAELNLPTAEPPKKTFKKSPYVLSDGRRRIEFHHFGWAHTKGDGFAFLPKEKILCTGDAVTNGPYNYTGDGHVANWPKVIAAAEKLGASIVLPGHGPQGGPEVLRGEAQFMTELHNAALRARNQNLPITDLVTLKDGKPVATRVTLPANVKNWVGDGLPTQVFDAYKELEFGKPRGDLKLD